MRWIVTDLDLGVELPVPVSMLYKYTLHSTYAAACIVLVHYWEVYSTICIDNPKAEECSDSSCTAFSTLCQSPLLILQALLSRIRTSQPRITQQPSQPPLYLTLLYPSLFINKLPNIPPARDSGFM